MNASPSTPSGSRGAVVAGAVVAALALAVLAVGAALVGVHATQRDGDGYYASGHNRLATPTRALVSENLDVGTDAPGWLFDDGRFGTLRLTASGTAEEPVFVGIARTAAVSDYLRGVDRDEITDFELDPFSVDTTHHRGPAVPGAARNAVLLGGVRHGRRRAGDRVAGRRGRLVGRRHERRRHGRRRDRRQRRREARLHPLGRGRRPRLRRRDARRRYRSRSCSAAGARRPPARPRPAGSPRGCRDMAAVATPSTPGLARLAAAAASLRTEAGLARVGLGLVALHVVDDTWLQPNPGHVGRRPSLRRPRPARRCSGSRSRSTRGCAPAPAPSSR